MWPEFRYASRTLLKRPAASIAVVARSRTTRGFWATPRTLIRSLQAEANIRLRPGFRGFVLPALAILLIACANVGNLLVMRLVGREKELAIRTALGAPPRQLVATALAREAPLVAAGLVTGIVGTLWVTALVWREILPITALDPGVWIGVFSVLLVAAALAALRPALDAVHIDPIDVLRAD